MTARPTLRSFVTAVAVCLASAPAWALTNKLYLNSQPGDYVGGGQTVTYTAGVFTATGGGTQTIDVAFHTAAYEHWWYLDFSAPQGQVLGPGMYEGAMGSPWQSPTHPGLAVYGDGRGCSKLTGRFVVLDASFDSNGNVLSFAADFEQHCEGQASALYGAIRFRSSLPIVPRLSVGNAAVVEGPSQTPMAFTISLSQPASSPVTVGYSTADGTAVAGSDYVATSGTVTFAPSETSKPITVQVLNDGAAQGDQYFYVNLSHPGGAILAAKQGTGRIVDGEGPQTFLILNSQPGDYIGLGQRQKLTVVDGAFSADPRVHIGFLGDTSWDLYFTAPGNAPLVPGMYEGAMRWPYQSPTHPGLDVYGDGRSCDTVKGRFLVLEASYAPNGDVQTFAADFEQHCEGAAPALYGSIRFNSSLPVVPRVSVSDAAVIEGLSPTPMTFTISLSEPVSGPVTVDYATADGTAVAGSDYVATSGTVTFAPSETSKPIVVQVLNDGAAQGDQYFNVNLGNSGNAVLGSSQAKGTVIDGEGPQTFLILNSQPGDYIGQGQWQKLTILDGASSVGLGSDQSVQVYFSGDTSWVLDLGAPGQAPLVPGMYEGATRWPFQSPTHPGLYVSGDGRFCYTLTGRFLVLEASYGPSGAVQSFAADFEQHCEGAAPALYGAIRFNSNLSVVPRLSVSDAAVIEGPSPTPMTFTISLSAPTAGTVTVDYATADGTALAGSDYVATSGTVTFAPSETAKPITVQVLNDGAAQGDQFFYVNIGNPTGAILGSSQGKGTVIDGEGPQTFLLLDSQPGDSIGLGQSQKLTFLDGVFSVFQGYGGLRVGFSGDTSWDVALAAPANALLLPGMYESATRFGFQSPTHPGLAVFGDGRGCNTLTGRFLVLEASYAPNGDVQAFAADFEQHCEGRAPALYGAIRINSTVPVVPRLSVGDAAAVEGPFPTPMTLMISLSEPASGPVTVDYATADGTALAGSDYAATSGTVTFTPPETAKAITVQVLNDGAAQGDQYFSVNLSNPSGATLASSQAKGSIIDSEGPQTFLFLNSQPGDYIGLGQLQKLTVLDGAFSADSTVHIRFWGDTSWDAYFTAPGGAQLVPGVYEDAEGWPFQSPGHPGLSVAGDGRRCSALKGRFVVLEAVYGGTGDLQRFAANFEQHCEGQSPALLGAVRFNSQAGPSADLVASVVSAATEVDRGQPLSFAFAVTNNGPDPVAGGTATFSSSRALAGLTWSCTTAGGATCGSGGAGVLADTMSVPVAGTVTYLVTAQPTQSGPVIASLCAAPPGGVVEWNTSNDCGQAITAVLSDLRGDFDGDGFSDILWQNPATRAQSVWYMNGAALQTAADLPPVQPGWRAVGTGDFTRDGLADVLLRQDSTGCLQVWDRGGGYSWTYPPRCDRQWEVVGVGDFDGDRRPDVLWRNTVSGALSVWLMDGLVRRSEVPLPLPRYASSWRVSAVADLDGDGQADLVMQRTGDDRILACFLNGMNVVRQAFIYPGAPAGYRLAGTADYDGDRRDDLIWQNTTTGELLLWYMDGNLVKATAVTTPATHDGTGWKVVGPR